MGPRQSASRIGTAWTAVIAVLAVIATLTVITSSSAAPAAADPTCQVRDATGKCVIWHDDEGDDDGDDPGDENDPNPPPGGETFDPAAVCAEEAPGWGDCVIVVRATGLRPSQICGYVYHPDQSALHYYEPDAPDDAVLVFNICPRDGLYYTEETDWVPAAEAAPPPSPAEVAARAYAELEVPAPELATDPGCQPAGPGEPWTCVHQLVQVPTFVEVTNWQGEFSVNRCEASVCVSLTAVPSLSFDPGDPDAGTIDCTPPGSRYVEGQGDPRSQAEAPGACAHAYTQDTESTASEGWLGEVTVTWQVSWAQSDSSGSDSGEFDPFSLSTEFLRPIYEVQSLVTDADLG